MRKIIVLWLALLLPPALFAQTLTDTVWSVPQLDGSISYRPVSSIFHITTSGLTMGPGDGWDGIYMEESFSRDYLSFRLTDLNHSDSFPISLAVIGVFQFDCFGNGQQGVYPIWNVAGGDTHFCVLDHIDYGNSLDLGDWTAGDPGDPQTMETNIGIISDNAVAEYKTLDVTPYVMKDIDSARTYNQYRMRFTIDLDYDSLGDFLMMVSGNSTTSLKPYLAVQYDTSTMAMDDSGTLISSFVLEQNYPNPFNPVTRISYSIPKTGLVELTVFDALGNKVQTLVNAVQIPGDYNIPFDGSYLSSGIYYYRIQLERQSITRKMLLIR